MDIKLPFSLLKFVPLSLKMYWSALFRVLKIIITLLNGRGQSPSKPTCTPPPPPSCARWRAVCYTLLSCYLFYRPCKQALLGYPEVRGWGREKGKSCRQSALGRLRVVAHFSSGIVGRAKREWAWKSPHARKGDTLRVAFSRVGCFSRALSFRSPYYPWGRMGDYS